MWATPTLFAGIPALKQYQAAVGNVRLLTGVHTDGLLVKPTAFLLQSITPTDTALH